jgi:imidazole glycerol-phosphate synthase subunit HisH
MIAIIDYGLGNIRAFGNVYKRLGFQFRFASRVEDLSDATRIILPGVGAFDYAIERLNQSGMRQALDELVLERKLPLLGVCVGMQMLGLSSEEGELPGLGWIDGAIKRFDTSAFIDRTRLPHMGWNNVTPTQNNHLFDGLDIDARFYFLHSYYFQTHNQTDAIAVTSYGQEFSCAVSRANIYGVQFHPEKSHQNGIQLLRNFANL